MAAGFTFEEALAEPDVKEPFSFTDAVGPDIGFPQLSPQATLPEALNQPAMDFDPYRGGIVPSLLPGVLQPEGMIQPFSESLRDKDELTNLGERISTRSGPQIIGGLAPPPSWLSREQDLASDKEIEMKQRALEWSPLGEPEKPIEEEPPTPGERISTRIAPQVVGGLAPLPSVFAKPQAPSSDMEVAVGRETRNMILGIPRFFTSLQGLLSSGTALVAPEAVTAYFTQDMVRALGSEIMSTYDNWGQMTQTQKATAVERMIGTGAMAGLLAKHSIGHAKKTLFGGDAETRPAIIPEQRETAKQTLMEKAKETGRPWSTVPGELEGAVGQVAHTTKDGSVVVSEKNLNIQLEQRLAKGVPLEEAIDSIISEESIHGASTTLEGGDNIARQFWDNLSGIEKAIIKRRYHGPGFKGRPLTDEAYGHEAIRFAIQRASKFQPGEHIFGAPGEIRMSKLLTAVEDVVRWIREKLGTGIKQKQLDYLNQVTANLEAAKKGAPDASSIEKATEVHGPMRAQPVEGVRQVPIQEGGPGVQPQAEAVAEAAQIPLTIQKDRASVLLKDVPVVKDVPPGSIQPDTIIPAIRLINGDVIHGWIKPNGKAATHPQIAKRYGITVEELDRKGWVSKDGKAFYEREPAAKGTQLPTAQKEGELHSTDKPAEAPPTAPTGEAPQAAPSEGKGKPGVTAPVEPAKPTISAAFSESKRTELDALNKQITSGIGFTKTQYDRWTKLSRELDAAEAAAGISPRPQSGEPTFYAMSLKEGERKIEDFRSALDEPELRRAKTMKYDVGMAVRSMEDLEELAKLKEKHTPEMPKNPSEFNEASFKAAKAQLAREATEVAISFGSQDEATAYQKLGDRPLDWRLNPKVAKWIVDNADRMGWTKNVSLPEVKDWVSRHAEPTRQFEYSPEDLARYQDLKERLASTPDDQVNGPEYNKVNREFESLRNKYNGNPPKQSVEQLAMSLKEEAPKEDLTPEGVVTKIVATVKGIKNNPEKRALVEKTAREILSKPKEQWHEALTDFHIQWRAKELQDAAEREALAAQTGLPVEAIKAGEDLAQALSPENIAAQFGLADRQTAYRGAIRVLNEKVVHFVPPSDAGRAKLLPAGGEPVNKAINPRYQNPRDEFLHDFRSRHPHIPKWVALEVWADAVHDVLNNASGERIKELLRPARLEKRFLGNNPAPQPGEVDMRRRVPDADPEPVFADMAKAPSPEQSVAFKKFCAVRDLTPEQGIEVLNQMRAMQTAEIREFHRQLESGKTIGKTAAGEAVLESGREEMGEGEKKQLFDDWRKERAINQKRRHDSINALSQWLIGEGKAPEKSPMRNTIGLDDIWFEIRRGEGAYFSYTPKQGEETPFLRKVLGHGAVKGKTQTLTRAITLLVDPKTGDYHAVSTYIREKNNPLLYDPFGIPGSKAGNHVDLASVLARYRVVGSLLVRDPVQRFHQKWRSDKGGKSGEQKFNEEIGAVARVKEEASREQWMEYIRGKEAEREEELRQQFEQRFEEEPAKPGEEAPVSIRKQSEKRRAAEHMGEWAEASDPDALSRKKPISTEDQASIEAWMRGPGSGPLGMYHTDLRNLKNRSLSGAESEAVYELLNDYKVTHPLDIQNALDSIQALRQRTGVMRARHVSAMYGIDKISHRVYERMKNSAYEQAKMRDLPPIPEDTEYVDMSPGEKEHYIAQESLKYRALLRTFQEIYDIAKEARTAPRPEGAASERLAVSPDAKAFGERALDRYGDTARRDIEQTALSSQRAAEAKYARELEAPVKGRIPPAGGLVAGKRFPREIPPPAMLPPGAAPYQPAPPPRGAFPTIPTTPSMIGGKGFKGALPTTIPERGTPVGYGQEKGYVPSDFPAREQQLLRPMIKGRATRYQPSLIRQAVEGQKRDPLAMTLKGTGVADRYREELVAQGRTSYKKEDVPFMPKEDLIARGRELVLSGKINPQKEMIQAERTGYLSVDSTLAFRYWDYRLQQLADAAAAKHGTDSPQYREMDAISAEWKKRLDNTSKTLFARTGHGLQGWNQIGPDDMKSTTFVRNLYRKFKAKEKGIDEEDYDLDAEDEAEIKEVTEKVAKSEVARKDLEIAIGKEFSNIQHPPLDPGQQKLADLFEKQSDNVFSGGLNILKSKKPKQASMAMKGKEGELPPLDPEELDALGNVGMKVMTDLSKNGDLTDARWIEEMKKVLNSPEVDRPDLEPYLPHARAISEQIRDTALNNFIGTGDAVKDARKIFTRKVPPIEESIAAIRRALEADPSGKKITPAEAYHVWNYLRQRFLRAEEPVLDFQVIRVKAAAELAIKDDLLGTAKTPYSELRLFRAISSKRSMRVMTRELRKRMRDEARIKGQAMNWLKNQQFPLWLRTVRWFPRLFFFDKIMGHGLVPMITHAPTMMFNPKAWSVYFGHWDKGTWKPGAWQEMYRMTFGTQPFRRLGAKIGMGEWEGQTGADYHDMMTRDLVNSDRFQDWKSAKLECEPFKYTDDYQIEALQTVLGPKLGAITGGRGFDSLKTLRYAMAEKWLQSFPEHLRNKQSMELIADSVNHATGIVKTRFHEVFNWLMFAPKLEASRWAYVFKDTVKAMDYIRNWKTATLEQRAWAKSEMKQKAAVVGWYFGMLALNQAFLKMCNSDQDINVTDPKKPDFMAFKVAGFRVGLASPFIGMVRLFANAIHAARGERTKFERMTSRQKQFGQTLWQYGRGKMSPLSSFATDIVTQEDFARRPLPWSTEPISRSRRLRGVTQYGTGEYILQTVSPIPVEEAVRDTFKSMGMDEPTINKLVRTLIIAGGMSATGARVAHDVE